MLRQHTEDSLRTIWTENERLVELHSWAESDLGRKDQEIWWLQEQIKQMNQEQSKMKAKLIEAVDIIAEREEALGQEPMEDIQETMFVNPVFSQQAPPQAPAASNETIFQTAI